MFLKAFLSQQNHDKDDIGNLKMKHKNRPFEKIQNIFMTWEIKNKFEKNIKRMIHCATSINLL